MSELGICECGCGQETSLITVNVKTRGLVKGQMRRFIRGHSSKQKDPVGFFWSKVDKNGPIHPVLGTRCWLFMGSRTKLGYGSTHFMGKPSSAQGIAWFLTYGTWIKNRACHHCDNPPCCNPEHIFDGTPKENTRDAMKKGRLKSVNGEQNVNAKLTQTQVNAIREEYAQGDTTHRKLAKKYGMEHGRIGRIVRGEGWRESFKKEKL